MKVQSYTPFIRRDTMEERCTGCNSVLQILRPQIGDQETVYRCAYCGRLIVLDTQPSAPETLPDTMPRYPVTLIDRPIPTWLN